MFYKPSALSECRGHQMRVTFDPLPIWSSPAAGLFLERPCPLGPSRPGKSSPKCGPDRQFRPNFDLRWPTFCQKHRLNSAELGQHRPKFDQFRPNAAKTQSNSTWKAPAGRQRSSALVGQGVLWDTVFKRSVCAGPFAQVPCRCTAVSFGVSRWAARGCARAHRVRRGSCQPPLRGSVRGASPPRD